MGEFGFCKCVPLLTCVLEMFAEQLLSAEALCSWRGNDSYSQSLLDTLHKSVFPNLFSMAFKECQWSHTEKHTRNF